MSTAVGVLAILAVFSVVGTLIPQSRSPQFYDATYGPDGADLIHLLGLDNVYSAWWFLAMAAFLVLSVSVCLTRNGPRLWRNMLKNFSNIDPGTVRIGGAVFLLIGTLLITLL